MKTFLFAILLGGLWSSTGALSAQTPNPAYAGEPTFYNYTLGKLQVTAVYDGYNVMSRKGYVANVDTAAVNDALRPMHFPADSVVLPFTATVIRTGRHLVVFDTGLGEAQFQRTRGKLGRFLTNFKAAGFDPARVDYVVISHFHADHIGGLVDAQDRPVFPNAKVLVPADEYDYWMNPGNLSATAPAVIQGNFARAQRIFKLIAPVKVGQNAEILPGIRTVNTHGHTPGHTSYLVSSGRQHLLLQGDLSNIPALFVAHPQWRVWSDMDQALAVRQRLKTYGQAVHDEWYVQGFPFPAVAKLAADGDGFKLRPVM